MINYDNPFWIIKLFYFLHRWDPNRYYCCIVICRFMQNTTTQWRRRATQSWRKIYLSLYWKGSKGLLKVLLWEGVGDRTELQYIDPHSYGHQRCVYFVLQGCSTGGPGAQLSTACWLPLPHLVTNGSGLQTNWLPVFTELYNSSIAHSISLEWHVWSSSSGNNCHAVRRSHSSGASVYDCTMGFYLVSAKPAYAKGTCNFRVFGMACLAESKVNIQHNQSGSV